MTRYVAGIDGGQSSTIAAIGDERGRILGYGRAGPSDEVGQTASSTRLRDALRDALANALRTCDLAPETKFEAIVAGVSGYDGRVRGVVPSMPTRRFTLLHDAPIAHAGAFGGLPGIIVIAGTGSVAYAVDGSGASATVGGWGYLFGDEGSAFWLAREALATMMRAHDARDESLRGQTAHALAFFASPTLRALVHAVHDGTMTRDRIASYARHVLDDDAFAELVEDGAEALARLANDAARACPSADRVALVGGLFTDAKFRTSVEEAIARRNLRVVQALHDPVVGAAILAYREAAMPIDEVTIV